MNWSELLLAFLCSVGGAYSVWFVVDCWWRGDWHVPDPPR